MCALCVFFFFPQLFFFFSISFFHSSSLRASHANVATFCVLQEVSAFGEEGEGDYLDDWTVLCNGPYWVRDGEVRFKHSSTEVLLSVTGEQYGRPISGQKEVHGMAQPSQNNYWKAMEGIFMKPSELLKAEAHHAEL